MSPTSRTLLLHGLSADSSAWWRVRDWFDGTVVAPDQRGHGTSIGGARYGIDDYAGDRAGTGPWDTVVGHSLGGAVAVRAAAREPGWARRLVLLDPVLLVPAEARAEVRAGQIAELGQGADDIASAFPHWHERDRAAKLQGITRVSPDVPARTVDDNDPWDVTADVAALRIPVLVLAGDPDVFSLMVPAVRDAVLANPEAEVVTVAGAGHAPHRDRPDEVRAALESWLARRS